MRIKYLLSGRIFSDTYQLRRLIDSWPDQFKFPEIVQDIKSIKEEDIVITVGYLGCSNKLILNHNPQKVFIIDNSLFPTKAISNFRVLNGNLNSYLKDNPSNFYLNYYRQKIIQTLDILKKFETNNISNKSKLILEFPWSLPLKRIINIKRNNSIKEFTNQTNLIKSKTSLKFIKYIKNGSAKYITKNNLPIIREYNTFKNLEDFIVNSEYIFCPTSTLAYMGILLKKNIIISEFNPFHKYKKENINLKDYNEDRLIETLSQYLSNLNHSITDIYEHLEKV